jgi:DNA-binding NarL/FixJ family response regulator
MADLATLRVLLLEDDPLLRRAWQRVADRMGGLELVPVETEEQARAALAQHAFEVVLCDFHLGDGRTSQALIEEIFRAGAPRLAVLTGDPDRVRRALPIDVRVIDKLDGLPAVLAALAAT